MKILLFIIIGIFLQREPIGIINIHFNNLSWYLMLYFFILKTNNNGEEGDSQFHVNQKNIIIYLHKSHTKKLTD